MRREDVEAGRGDESELARQDAQCHALTRPLADPFLPVRTDFHPKRNQARQKLATLPKNRFKDLASDVFYELNRRFPDFKRVAPSDMPRQEMPQSVVSRHRKIIVVFPRADTFHPTVRPITIRRRISDVCVPSYRGSAEAVDVIIPTVTPSTVSNIERGCRTKEIHDSGRDNRGTLCVEIARDGCRRGSVIPSGSRSSFERS